MVDPSEGRSLLAIYAPIAGAAISTIISAGIAWFIARRNVKTEIDKLNIAAQQKVLEHLIIARLAVYHDLYQQISDLLKHVRHGHMLIHDMELLYDYMKSLMDNVNEWDSRHALLLGPITINKCYDFRSCLRDLVDTLKKGSNNFDNIKELIIRLRTNAQLLELALRSDLGIYGITLTQAPNLLQTPEVNRYSGDKEVLTLNGKNNI